MGITNRPQNILFNQQIWFRKYYYGQPQELFLGGAIPPEIDNELIEETLGVFDKLLFDEGVSGDSGFVLIEEA